MEHSATIEANITENAAKLGNSHEAPNRLEGAR